MPFILFDGTDTYLFFCKHNGSTWKAHVLLPSGKIVKLRTGYGHNVCECSPSAWFDGNWNVSLVAGGGSEQKPFMLSTYRGESLSGVLHKKDILQTLAGFNYHSWHAHGLPNDLVFVHGKHQAVLELTGAQIYRVTYRSDNVAKILISGGWGSKDKLFTVEYDLETSEQNLLLCDGKPAYKCSIFGDTVLYTDRIGSDFEDRRITLANKVEWRPVSYITKHE